MTTTTGTIDRPIVDASLRQGGCGVGSARISIGTSPGGRGRPIGGDCGLGGRRLGLPLPPILFGGRCLIQSPVIVSSTVALAIPPVPSSRRRL